MRKRRAKKKEVKKIPSAISLDGRNFVLRASGLFVPVRYLNNQK